MLEVCSCRKASSVIIITRGFGKFLWTNLMYPLYIHTYKGKLKRIMRTLSTIRRLFVSKKRSKDLKLRGLMYGGDTWMPTFIFKSLVFKSARCLCLTIRGHFEKGSPGNVISTEIRNSNIAFFGEPIRIWLLGCVQKSCPQRLFLF